MYTQFRGANDGMARVFRNLIIIGLAFAIVSCSQTKKSENTNVASSALVREPATRPTSNSASHSTVKSAPITKSKSAAVHLKAEPEKLEPPPSVTHREVARYLEAAENLLARAEVHARSGGPGQDQDWFDEDRAFQAKGDALSKRITLRLARTQQAGETTWDSVAFDITHNIGQAESFLFSAVQSALASCNRHDADANLRVARADIREARRDFDKMKRDPDNWGPPEIEETGGDECVR